MTDAPHWLTEGLLKLDHGQGIERHEIEMLIKWAGSQAERDKENSDELDYTMFPEAVREALSEWDDDNSGGVSVQELLVRNHHNGMVREFRRWVSGGVSVQELLVRNGQNLLYLRGWDEDYDINSEGVSVRRCRSCW
jgi:hypothetical protein